MERTTIFERQDDDEKRAVATWEDEEGLHIEERTEGPVTRCIYEERWHVQQLVVAPKDIPAAAALIGADPAEVASGLAGFFDAAPYRLLVDLMDRMDRRGVVYGYRSWGSGTVCFRPAIAARRSAVR